MQLKGSASSPAYMIELKELIPLWPHLPLSEQQDNEPASFYERKILDLLIKINSKRKSGQYIK